MNIQLFPCSIGGRLCAPPSKSMAHRSVLAAALAEGTSPVQNLAQSRDIQATLAGVARLGAKIAPADGGVAITGAGAPARWRFDPAQPVDCGESGSTLRFFIPVFSLTGETVRFCGWGRLFSRPQQVYADLFAARGLAFAQTEQGVTLKGALPPGDYTLPGDVSSQFITGLLYALPLLPGDSTITLTGKVESRPYIDLTLSALADFGVTARWLGERRLAVPGGQHYRPCSYRVEGDYSQAAFPAVLGAVCGGVTVTGLRPDSLQGDAAILDILARCGANFTRTGDEVRFQAAPLRATAIDLAACPDLGPILMVLGLFCEGDTVITNAEQAQHHEDGPVLRRRHGHHQRRAAAHQRKRPHCRHAGGAGQIRRAGAGQGRNRHGQGPGRGAACPHPAVEQPQRPSGGHGTFRCRLGRRAARPAGGRGGRGQELADLL